MEAADRLLCMLLTMICLALLGGLSEAPPVSMVAHSPEAIRPGHPFEIRCTLNIPERWHIYWEDPGASGAPTRIDVEAPDGWKIGPLRFPRPRRMSEPSGMVNALEGQIELGIIIEPPSDAPHGIATITMHGMWLVCRDRCFIGEATRTIAVHVDPNASGVHSHLDLPGPIHDRPETDVRWEGHSLIITGPLDPSGQPGFIVSNQPGVEVGSPTIHLKESRFELILPVAYDAGDGDGHPARVRGLLTFGTRIADPAFIIDIPIPVAHTVKPLQLREGDSP